MVHHKPYNRSLQKEKRKTNPLWNCCRPTTETPAWMLHVFSFSSINVDFHISSLQIFNTNSKVVVTPERLHNFFNPPKVSLPDVDASPRKTRVSFEATVDKVSSLVLQLLNDYENKFSIVFFSLLVLMDHYRMSQMGSNVRGFDTFHIIILSFLVILPLTPKHNCEWTSRRLVFCFTTFIGYWTSTTSSHLFSTKSKDKP